MEHVLIIHDVEDYDAWKKIFDAAAPIRKMLVNRAIRF
jgi:hypothetical protein